MLDGQGLIGIGKDGHCRIRAQCPDGGHGYHAGRALMGIRTPSGIADRIGSNFPNSPEKRLTSV